MDRKYHQRLRSTQPYQSQRPGPDGIKDIAYEKVLVDVSEYNNESTESDYALEVDRIVSLVPAVNSLDQNLGVLQ